MLGLGASLRSASVGPFRRTSVPGGVIATTDRPGSRRSPRPPRSASMHRRRGLPRHIRRMPPQAAPKNRYGAICSVEW